MRVVGKQLADVTESEDSDDDGVSGRPRSFSPMFGKGRRDGVQCWNRQNQSITMVEMAMKGISGNRTAQSRAINDDRLLRRCPGGGIAFTMWKVHAHLWKSISESPLLQIPGMTPAGIYSLVSIRSRHGASGHFVRKHERHKTSQSKIVEMWCQK